MAGLESVGTNGGTRTFQGALGVLEIEELTQAIAVGGKTGRLVLVLTTGGGLVVFESGRVTHAEYGGQAGEPAFGALVAGQERHAQALDLLVNLASGQHHLAAQRTPGTDRTVGELGVDLGSALAEAGQHLLEHGAHPARREWDSGGIDASLVP